MSNSKKSWTASKANMRSVQANKKTLKMTVSEAKAAQKRVAKVKKA